MKVERSSYLAEVKPLLRKLLDKVLEQYPYASILATDSVSKNYSVSKKQTFLTEDSLLSGRGFVIKAYDGSGYGEYSFNEISEENLDDIAAAIQNQVFSLGDGLGEEVSLSAYKKLQDDPIVFSESTEYEISPEEYGDEHILAYLTEIKDRGLAYSDKIINCSVNCAYQIYHKMFLSRNRDMEQNVMWTTGGVYVATSRGEEGKDCFRSFSTLGGMELLKSMQEGLNDVCQAAVELLDSLPMVPGEYDCICTPEVTGMIAHEAFGHGVEMDMFVKDRALAKEYIGQYVASPLVTMHDGASAARETATFFFDDEGTLASDTIVIEKGVLKRGIADAQTALHLGTVPTGNGRRESFMRKAYTRMTNTYFEPGQDKVEDMIASISYGMLLENATSGMEDPKNWGIQCMVNMAREIRDGKLTGKIFSPVVLTGYVPDLLKSISMMSDTLELGGGGFCGKGYKEWVKVSDGGPYIKAKIRLG